VTTLGTCELIAFAATADPARARAFYETVLGLRFVSDEPHSLVFDANGTMLRIQKVEAVSVAPSTRLGWRVPDLAEAVSELAERGVTFARYDFLPQDERGIWTTPDGARIAWFSDPDGNTLSLTEWPR
jgi:catechol 2,3-dioxygenase-like lactoylglutathione lyase family enzyme